MERSASVIAARKKPGKYDEGDIVRTETECMMWVFDALEDYDGERR